MMKKYILFAGVSIMSICANAQYYDYGMAARMLEMQNYQSMNNILNQLSGMVSDYTKNNMSVAADILLADNSDRYNAFVALSHSSIINDITICCYMNEDLSDLALIDKKDCSIFGQFVILPAVLRPGHKLRIVTNEKKSRILYAADIPKKGTTAYDSFKTNAYNNIDKVNSYLSIISGGGTVMQDPPGTPTTKSRAPHPCNACKSTGRCGTCNGTGYYIGSYGAGTLKCPNCSATNGRICSVCNGKGSW